MPLPLIVPIGIGTVTIVTGGIGVAQAIRARKRRKNAQAKWDASQKTTGSTPPPASESVKELNLKLAELSYARLEANSTLGRAAKFMGQVSPSKQVNLEAVGVTSNHIADWISRSETADELLKTLSGFGVGAAGVYGAWAAAGLGTASTGTAISTLTGAAATTAKLAWLGGGATAIGGGGMMLGWVMLGALPIGPGILAGGILSMINAKNFEKAVDDALKAKLTVLRIDELIGATKAVDHALRELLNQCSPKNPSDVQAVASISHTLAQVVDIPITDDQGNILNEDAMKNAYRPHLLRTRRQELSQTYNRLRDAIANQAYPNAIRIANHILSIIKL